RRRPTLATCWRAMTPGIIGRGRNGGRRRRSGAVEDRRARGGRTFAATGQRQPPADPVPYRAGRAFGRPAGTGAGPASAGPVAATGRTAPVGSGEDPAGIPLHLLLPRRRADRGGDGHAVRDLLPGPGGPGRKTAS